MADVDDNPERDDQPNGEAETNGRAAPAAQRPHEDQADALPGLLPQHLSDLRKSGLSNETILACRFRSYTSPEEVARLLGWTRPAAHLAPALGVPFPGPDGQINGYIRVKPDNPRVKDDKPVKYESPLSKKYKGNRAFFPPTTLPILADPAVPLLLTEGEKKAAAADQAGFPCVGLVGVFGWQVKQKNKAAARELIPDLEAVAWKGRVVHLCYDSDCADKPEVAWGEWHLAEALAAKGAEVKVVRLPSGPDGAAKIGLDDFLVAYGADALHKLLTDAREPQPPEDRRPVVALGTQEHRCIAKAVEALANDPEVYQRGGLLVRVVRPLRPENSPAAAGAALKIEAVPTADLRTRLTRHARIVQIVADKKTKRKVAILTHPPPWLVQGVEALGRWPGIRPLEAVVTSPTLLPDGSVIQKPGYHVGSGLLYQPLGDFPPVPDQATQGDAIKARDELLEIVYDFPFQAESHRSAWLAGLLTPAARFAFAGPSPLFMVNANLRGVGKGYATDAAATVAYGEPLPRTAYPEEDEELRKMILAIAMEGRRGVMFDNVAGSFGGPSLDAALTATEWEGRILGKTQQPRLPLLVTWHGTANNIAIAGDTGRRVCLIRLESQDEHPEEKSDFKHPDLLVWVRENRGRLLTAALTILVAFCRAGRPDQKLKAWGSYEGWSALVRNAVVWVGMADPGDTRQESASRSDRDLEALRGLLAGWQEIDPGREGKTVNAALGLCKDKANADKFPTLRDTLADLFDLPVGKLPPAGKLGYVLRRFRGRNVGGVCFDAETAHGGVQLWKIRTIGAKPASAEGESQTSTPALEDNGESPKPADDEKTASQPPEPEGGRNGKWVAPGYASFATPFDQEEAK